MHRDSTSYVMCRWAYVQAQDSNPTSSYGEQVCYKASDDVCRTGYWSRSVCCSDGPGVRRSGEDLPWQALPRRLPTLAGYQLMKSARPV